MATRWFANSGTSERHRPVLLHYHFFKNAGTTIESILKQNFPRRLAHFDSEDHNATSARQSRRMKDLPFTTSCFSAIR